MRPNKNGFWLAALCVFAGCLKAQNGDLVFNDTVLHRIDISIHPFGWFDTLEQDYKNNKINPDLYPEIYRECDVVFDGIALKKCGIREKGNSSNNMHNGSKKKPFKIAFDEFTNQNLDGLKKINLNNFTNDPSLVHEAISYRLMRQQGQVACRTSYVKVYFNGEYWGLYLIIENVDKTFLKMRYGSANAGGNLYKTDPGAQMTLQWLGNEDSAYIKKKFILKTNESVHDWKILIGFLDQLNHLPDDKIHAYLDSHFAVTDYLKVLAVEKYIRNWDNYATGANNFYLYEHPDGKIRYIPWDQNESFQDLNVLRVTRFTDGYLIPTKRMEERPLIKRIFSNPAWKQAYLDICCTQLHTGFTLKEAGPAVVRWHQLISKAYMDDPNKFNTWGSFERSLYHTHTDEMPFNKSSYQVTLHYPGIFPFLESQQNWMYAQLEGWKFPCSKTAAPDYHFTVYPNPAKQHITIGASAANYDFSRLQFYHSSGKLIKDLGYVFLQGSVNEVDISGLPAGLYMLVKTDAGGGRGVCRVVVQE